MKSAVPPSRRRRFSLPFHRTAAWLLAALAPLGGALAQLPTGGQVVAGNVAISQAAGAMTLTQTSRNAIVNWQTFNLGAENSLRLRQSGADAAMLARVVGNDPSKLLGSLKADGKLFLINPNGILVGAGARIDTAAFLASTLDISDDNFLRGGALTFKGDSTAGVVNLGRITAREGSVMLFAHTVQNAGEIDAENGAAGLGAGTEVYLASPDATDFLIKTSLSSPAAKTGVDNAGVIAAARAQLEAAGGSLYELAVNQSGVVRATGSATVNGRVLLTADGGAVGVSGDVSARNADGSGGEILVGGDYRGANAAVANAARTVVTATATLDAGAGGRAIVWADDTTTFLGRIVTGGDQAGLAEVSGRRFLDFRPASTFDLGRGGTLLLDPDALYVGTADPGDAESFLSVTTLQNQLAASSVTLDTSASTGDITFDAAVTWTTDNSLTVKSGNNINLNADITGGAGSTLALYTGRTAPAPPETDLPDIDGEANLDSAATVTVGTLIYGANGDSNPGPDYTLDDPAGTGAFFADGNLNVGTLELDLTHGWAGVSTDGSDNTIRAFKTTGDGDFGAYVVNHHGDLDVTLNATQVDGGYLQFFTPGNLTLKSGSSLAFTRPGTVILASTAGAFINEAGADVFGDNARFLIYTSTTGATAKGGLTGTEVFNHPYDDADDFDDTVSRFLYSAASGSPLLTYTADSFTRKYGAANPAFTYTVDGWLETVTDDVTGDPVLSATATQASGVGVYDITISVGTLASSNYDFRFEPGTLTITRAPLTIAADDATRRIGFTDSDFGVTYSGFVLGQDKSALGGTLAVTTPATASSPAGAYTLMPAGLTSANYNITFAPGTLTLTETAALLISANNASRTYGAADPAFTASYSGFVPGEDESLVTGLQFSTTATQTSGIGLYTITPYGATAAGYDISYEPGTLEITRAPLTISIPNQSRFYGDANDFTVNYNGLVNGEQGPSVIHGLSVTAPADETSTIGNYAITASGATADNYSITYSQGTLTVAPAPLTVTIDPATRHYGDADPAFTYTVSGLKNHDGTDLVTVANLDSLATPEAGVGSYTILGFPFTSSPNYSVAAQITGTLTVTPRPLMITADNATRVYGDPNPAFTATFTGLASFDTPALFGDLGLTTQATQTSGVGDWGITFAPVNNPNYAVTPQFGTLTITPALLTYQPLADLSRLYGRANPDMTLPAVDGLKNGDAPASLGLAFETPALTADAGTYTYRLTTTNPNYELASGTGLFRIDPAPLTVAITPTGRLYGEANPATYEFTANGLAFGQSAASVLSINNPASLYAGVGTYALQPIPTTGNYVVTAVTGGSFQVNPRVVTLDLPYYARYYGDLNPVFFNGDIVVGGDGLASFDSISSIVSELHTATPTTSLSNTGYYRIDPTFAANPNYRYSWTPGYLAVMPRPVEITVGDGVSFGNNNVPGDFDADALGVSLIIFDDTHLSGTGYHIEMSNPAPGADLAELLKHVKIVLSTDNTPQTVSVPVSLDQVPFPARPGYTPPVSASDPLPDDSELGIKTIELTQYMPPPPTAPSTVEDLLQNVVFSGGQFIVDYTGVKKDERFADVTRYLLAQPSLGGNYVVTAIHNGKLTMKADPVVVQHTLDTEAAYQQLVDAREALLQGTTVNGMVQHTFGLTQDEFPLIQEAFANMLFDMIRTDPYNDFLRILSGGEGKVTDINQIPSDAITLWLADIHTNSAKQALLAPAMASYGVKIAGLTPAQRTPLQQKLVDQMAPYLADARSSLISDAKAAQAAWVDMQTGNTTMTTLTGAEVPYEKFISSAVDKTVSKAFDGIASRSGSMDETDTMRLLGLSAGAATGVTAGAISAQIVSSSVETIFPSFKATELLGKFSEEFVDASKAAAGFEASSAVFSIVSIAVTTAITKAVAVGEEERHRQDFEKLLASGSQPIDPYALSETTQGHAILTLGLLKMFGGG